MIRDLGLFSWRIGLVLVFVLPLLYFTHTLVLLLGIDQDNLAVRALFFLNAIGPASFLAIAFGCALCLLVRIESHLRASREQD